MLTELMENKPVYARNNIKMNRMASCTEWHLCARRSRLDKAVPVKK